MHILSCITSSKGFTPLVSQCKAANTGNTVCFLHNLPTNTLFNKCETQEEGDNNIRLILGTHKNKCIALTSQFCSLKKKVSAKHY